MNATALIRVRFPFPTLERLDTLATRLRAMFRRRVPRAALVRALVKLALDSAVGPEIAETIKADVVRRGREKGPRARRAAT